VIAAFLTSCNKLVEIPPPTSSITTSQVFADSIDANSAVLGIYSKIFNQKLDGGSYSFGNSGITLFCGISADELIPYSSQFQPFYFNTLLSSTPDVGRFWTQPYSYIYQANACIEGIQSSTTIEDNVRKKLIGEAKFLRAFCYFYLVNLFGDIPYISSTNWAQSSLSARTSSAEVYDNVIADLKNAQEVLPIDYSNSGGERVRANRDAASALLARVYLFQKKWADAEALATSVIQNSSFLLEPDLNNVFLSESKEAILQFKLNSGFPINNITPEGYYCIPYDSTVNADFYFSTQLLDSFEVDDQRKSSWINSSKAYGVTYYYPFKYKVGVSQYQPNATPKENYMVLRLAEQYLIRAEAEANGAGGGIAAAISDLNMIRNRAGLQNYSGNSDKSSVLNGIYHERKVELFAEWGHRWLDLKRTGLVDSVMSKVTPLKGGGTWNSNHKLFPIPLTEIQYDPNLVQNTGY
jgi:hypothetical protein